MIKLNKITYSLADNAILKGIDLIIHSGEIFGIIGRSGAGKSTLVRTFNLLTKPNSGDVVIDGEYLTDCTKQELMLTRRKIGMIFQNFNLLNSHNVLENIALPLEFARFERNLIQKKITSIIELVGLGDYRYRYPYELSGGQKQRVAIARALACEPKILLSDESTSALDPEMTHSILLLIKKLNIELNITVVLVTHQMEVVKEICQRVAVMDNGCIVENSSVIDIFLHPSHQITRQLMGHISMREMPQTLKARILSTFIPGKDHLFRFIYATDNVGEPIISKLSRTFELNLSILYGKVEEIQGQAVGSLIVLISGSWEKVEKALAFLEVHGVVFEELSLVGEVIK